MNAKEFRVGNWVLIDKKRPHRISGHDLYAMDDVAHHRGCRIIYSSPIPLTPEVLEKCGFENDNGEYQHPKILEMLDFIVQESDNKGIWCAYNMAYNKVGSSDVGVNYPTLFPICCPFKYLHQLQNLVYSITGEELPYNP